MTVELNALLCCPFCGERNDLSIREKASTTPTIEGSIYYHIECSPCDAKSGNCFDRDARLLGYDSGKQMAISKWNTRAK